MKTLLLAMALSATDSTAVAPIAADPTAATAPAYDPLLSQLDVRSDVAPREALLGAEIRWTTGVTHPTNGTVGFAEPYTGGALTVKSSDLQFIGDGQAVATVVLTGLDLGDFTLPPLTLRFTDEQGTDHPFHVLGGKVTIVSSGEVQQTDLIAPVGIYQWNWWFFAALALAALLAGFVVWRMRQPKPEPLPPPPPRDPRTPAQRALDEIFKLQTSGLLERREIKAFTYALDDIIRRFVIENYGEGELTQTTDEFLAALHPAMHPDEHRHVAAFFAQGDRVRFAGEEHEVSEAKALCESAIALTNLGKQPGPPGRKEG
jgi:hypothetical protein